MRTAIKTLLFVGFGVFLCGVMLTVENTPRMVLVGDAEAIIGMPWTPMSAAGVARRTTRRIVFTEAAVATSTAATASAASAAAAASTPPPPPAAPAAATGVPVGTVVQNLPAGCASVVFNGVNYSDCKGVYYKAAFQGNNLVYVVVPKPMP